MITLTYPFDEKAVRALKAGDAVSITGRLYTGRDKFHKFVADGGALPVDFTDGALYHCGPVCVRDGADGAWRVVAAGPTTSVRENPYEPAFIVASGVRLIVGKGGMDAATLAAMKRHGCVYVQAVGGAGALYAAAVRRVAGVSLLDEFGAAEAVWHFDVVDFRGVVAMDAHGRSLFAEVAEASARALAGLRRRLVAVFCGLAAAVALAADPLADGFRQPDRSFGPETWWHWMNGNVSREGIVADLDAMAEIGLSGVHIFDAGCGIPPGELSFNTPDWFETVRFAVAEAQRRGLRTTLANCSGYSTAGGPWITPDNSMKTVRYAMRDLDGPCVLTDLPPQPTDTFGFYADIATLAYPVPTAEERSLALPTCPGTAKADRPFAATTLELRMNCPGGWTKPATLTLEARRADGAWRTVVTADVAFAREGMVDRDLQAIPFAETVAAEWRVRVSPIPAGCSVTDVRISRAGRVANVANKALFLRTRAPSLPYDAAADQCVPTGNVRRVSVGWSVPPGRWRILRVGYAANGRTCHPASKNGVGLECDKLAKRGIDVHFDAYIGKMCDFLGPELAGDVPCGFNSVLVDSWEAGSQNWTQGLEREFRARKGYDLIPWLPAFAGAVVGDRVATERTLADFREVVADLFAENFADEFARKCHARGLTLTLEAYGSFPSTPDRYARAADIGMCEFWSPPAFGLGDRTVRLTCDYFHARDPRKIIAAEAFTGKPKESRWQQDPYSLKAVGDRMFALGVNRIVYHRYAHQPWTNPTRYPGMTMGPWGMHFERTETWWRDAREWIRYQTRCQFLLQKGAYVASSREEPVRWLARQYEDGSRAFFLACGAPTGVTHRVELPFAAGEPEIWDPERGRIVRASGFFVENDRTFLDVAFKPSGATFVVFRPQPTADAACPDNPVCDGTRPVDGPWDVSFRAVYDGAPEPVRMATLTPLNESAVEGIRHFSGTAVYRTTFDWSGAGRAWLDLGRVKNLATVVLNGRAYPTLWRPPFAQEVTDALRPGKNELEVRVTNLWVNRLIGDEKLAPDVAWCGQQIREVPDWVRAGKPSPTGRHTFTTWHHWSQNDRLLESGLIGPVQLRFERGHAATLR